MPITITDVENWIEHEMSESFDYRALPGSIEVIEDPKVSGTFAVQFDDEEDGITHLLFVTDHAIDMKDKSEILETVLEEVTFDTWPPTVGEPKFFW